MPPAPGLQIFRRLPWNGGINTSADESVISPNDLVLADNIEFTTDGSRKKRNSIDFNHDDVTAASDAVIGGKDTFLFISGAKVQRKVTVTEARVVNEIQTDGTTTAIDESTSSTNWSGTLSTVSMEVLGNRVIIAVSGNNNRIKKWAGGSGDLFDLGDDDEDGSVDAADVAPDASAIRVHLGRLWTNDKDEPERLHYSTTHNADEFNGNGDSGALDIGQGDGDAEGITCIFPTYKGELYVAKQTKLYRISGFTPETFQVTKISDSLGCVGPNAATAVDQDDITFVSRRGIHSLVATIEFGDVGSKFISQNIQTSFNDDWSSSRLKSIHAAYLPRINSIGFAVSDSSLASASENNSIWLYNILFQSWYRWKDIGAASLFTANDSDQQRFYIGLNNDRLAKAQTNASNDTNNAGNSTPIPYEFESGLVFPDTSPYNYKGFKKFVLYYQKQGDHSISVKLTIDNFPEQELTYTQTASSDLLGTTFTLGTSLLGISPVMAGHAQQIEGFGRGIKINVSSSGANTDDVAIQGYGIEFEAAGTGQEVIE